MDDEYYLIKKKTLDDLAEATRYRNGKFDDLGIDDILDELNKPFYRDYNIHCIDNTEKTEWIRPSDWPDLDSLNLDFSGETDFIYATYDTRFQNVAIAWHLESYNTKPLTLDIGHIDNGEYIVDETFSVKHNSNFTKWLEDYPDYIVVRITGVISYAYLIQVTSSESRRQAYRQQPIVERYSCLPHAKYISGGSSSVWSSSLLKHEIIANGNGNELLSLGAAWQNAYQLESLDISRLRTHNVTNMSYMFAYCYWLHDLDLSNFDTGKVTNMAYMFVGTYALTNLIGIDGLNTSKVENFSYMFNACSWAVEPDDLSNFDMSSANNISYMFSNCKNLRKITLNWEFTRPVDAGSLFSTCWNLIEVDLSNTFIKWIRSWGSTFNECVNLKKIKFNLSERNEIASSIGSMFASCASLLDVDLSWLKVTSLCTNIGSLFSGCSSLSEIDIPTDWDLSGVSSAANQSTSIFLNCTTLKTVTGICDWAFYHTNSIGSIFSGCCSLEYVDVSNWKVDTVSSIASMFSGCYSLKHVDLSKWRPNNATSIASLFLNCYSLIDCGDLSNILSSSITSISNVFQGCRSLSDISFIENWDTSNVLYMNSTFSGYYGISSLPISNWDVSNVLQITTCFSGGTYPEFVNLDLSKWDLSSVDTAPGNIVNTPLVYNYKPFKNLKLSHQYSCYSMSYDSAIAILENLPRVTSTQTLKIGADTLPRLSTEDRKIATNKGWTLAS